MFAGINKTVANFTFIDNHGRLWYNTNSKYNVCLMEDGIWTTVVEDVKETEVLNMYSTITVDGLEYFLIPKNNV